MVSGTTVAAVGALAFAGATGAYYLYSKTLRLSISYSQATDTLDWTAGGGTPGGGYTIDLGGLAQQTGDFDNSGNATGSFPVNPASVPAADYEVLIQDLTTLAFKGIYVQLA